MSLLKARKIKPMLAGTVEAPFDSKTHIFEPKWDGLRCIAYIEGGRIELQNRNLRFVTRSYPELHSIPENVAYKRCILDGEVVVLKEGIPNFEKLQARFGVEDEIRVKLLQRSSPVTFVVFDLLNIHGKDLGGKPLRRRKRLLRQAVTDGPHILYSDHIIEYGRRFFRGLVKKGFEGTIAKQVNSPYLAGQRSDYWLKIKGTRRADCVIVGYTEGTGRRSGSFGALVLAAYDHRGNLRHVGNVGSGLTDRDLESLSRRLRRVRIKRKPVDDEVQALAVIMWVQPRFVCEVEYASITSEGKFRLPRFRALRLDKSPEECELPTAKR